MNRKNVVITGATKGIGKALALLFFEQGFDLAICARNGKELNEFKNFLASKNTEQKVVAISCDVSRKESLQDFADQVAFEFEQIDVLIHNAGIFKPGSIMQEEDGTFEQLMQTNVASAYYLTRFLGESLKQPGAHIFTICSTASITPYINGGSYCLSKFALLGLTKVLREEFKTQGIRVTAVLPGATYTNSWEGSEVSEQRMMPPEDIAQSIWSAYQLSDRTVVEELLIRPQLGDL